MNTSQKQRKLMNTSQKQRKLMNTSQKQRKLMKIRYNMLHIMSYFLLSQDGIEINHNIIHNKIDFNH